VPKKPETTLTTAALLSKYGVNLEDDDPTTSAISNGNAATPTAQRSAAQQPATPAPAQPEHEEHDDYMKEYMARLLNKPAHQATQTTRETVKAAPAAVKQSPIEKPKPKSEAPVRPATDELPAILNPREMAPRTLPPEMALNMRAMRELANQNTQQAIRAHLRKQMSASAVTASIVASVGFTSSLLLFWLWFQGHETSHLGAGACLAISVMWGLRYWTTRQKLARSEAPQKKTTEERLQSAVDTATKPEMATKPETTIKTESAPNDSAAPQNDSAAAASAPIAPEIVDPRG
jgi:hypothetical protein